MSGDPRPDETLMHEVKGGSVAAFQALYDRHSRVVFNFLLRSLGNWQIAQDLFQETFLRVFAHREDYRPRAPFRAWLFTIARNLVVDQLRQRSSEPAVGSAEALETLADAGATPIQQLEAWEVGERLQAAALKLPPSQREVLLLRVAGLSVAEIAEVTGGSPGSVRVTLHRAIHRLRDFLGAV